MTASLRGLLGVCLGLSVLAVAAPCGAQASSLLGRAMRGLGPMAKEIIVHTAVEVASDRIKAALQSTPTVAPAAPQPSTVPPYQYWPVVAPNAPSYPVQPARVVTEAPQVPQLPAPRQYEAMMLQFSMVTRDSQTLTTHQFDHVGLLMTMGNQGLLRMFISIDGAGVSQIVDQDVSVWLTADGVLHVVGRNPRTVVGTGDYSADTISLYKLPDGRIAGTVLDTSVRQAPVQASYLGTHPLP